MPDTFHNNLNTWTVIEEKSGVRGYIRVKTNAQFNATLRNQIQEFGILRRMGFHYDPNTGVLTIPSNEALSEASVAARPNRVRFETHFDREDVPELIYARRQAENIQPIGIGEMREHDIAIHIMDHLAIPQSAREVMNSHLKYWLAVYDDPVLKLNKELRAYAADQIKMQVNNYDVLNARRFLSGLKENKFTNFGREVSFEEAPFVTKLKKYIEKSAKQIAHDVEAAINPTTGRLAATWKVGPRRGLSYTVPVSQAEREALARITAQQSDRAMSVGELKKIMMSEEYRKLIFEEP
jgi:hypothetical protein